MASAALNWCIFLTKKIVRDDNLEELMEIRHTGYSDYKVVPTE